MTLRCPECRTRRSIMALMSEHIAKTDHKLCNCGGYHFKHRPGSPYCEANVWSDFNRALRDGATRDDLLEIRTDMAWRNVPVDKRPI